MNKCNEIRKKWFAGEATACHAPWARLVRGTDPAVHKSGAT